MAIGSTAWSPGQDAEGFGMAALVWTVITLLAALLIGGHHRTDDRPG